MVIIPNTNDEIYSHLKSLADSGLKSHLALAAQSFQIVDDYRSADPKIAGRATAISGKEIGVIIVNFYEQLGRMNEELAQQIIDVSVSALKKAKNEDIKSKTRTSSKSKKSKTRTSSKSKKSKTRTSSKSKKSKTRTSSKSKKSKTRTSSKSKKSKTRTSSKSKKSKTLIKK